MKTIFCHVLAISFLAACGQSSQSVALKRDSTSLIAAVKSAPRADHSSAEYRHFNGASKHFFDSLFLHGFNGGLLVARNGEVVYERYGGFSNCRNKKDTFSTHTSIHLASVSKTFTAMAVLKLWEEGKLDIHDDISKYLAGFPPGITVKNLLSQRSGLMNYVHFMDQSGWDKRKFLTNTDLLKYVIANKAMVQHVPPNRHFEYSNTNYAFLALIIEKASGMTYHDFITKTFLEPLGMHDSYVYTLADTDRATCSYHANGIPFRMEYLDVVYGDKNVYSTPEDMLRWDAALRGGILFRKSTLDSAYTPYSLEKPGKRNYGLGWRMMVYPNGKKLIYHNGWWHGNRTVFIRMIEENATIIALCNNDNKRVYSSKKLCDVFGNYQAPDGPEEPETDPEGRSGEKR